MRTGFRLLRLPDKRRKQRPVEHVILKSTLRMPLDTHDKSPGRVFNRFDNAIGRCRYSLKVCSPPANRLMMKAVHLDGVCAGKPPEEAVPVQMNDVPGRLLRFPMVVVEYRRGDN